MAKPYKHKNSITEDLAVFVFKRDKNYIAQCPSLDLVTQGKTYQEALDSIKEIVEVFFEETAKRKTLDQALAELGWVKTRSHWSPPVFVGRADIPAPVHA